MSASMQKCSTAVVGGLLSSSCCVVSMLFLEAPDTEPCRGSTPGSEASKLHRGDLKQSAALWVPVSRYSFLSCAMCCRYSLSSTAFPWAALASLCLHHTEHFSSESPPAAWDGLISCTGTIIVAIDCQILIGNASPANAFTIHHIISNAMQRSEVFLFRYTGLRAGVMQELSAVPDGSGNCSGPVRNARARAPIQ